MFDLLGHWMVDQKVKISTITWKTRSLKCIYGTSHLFISKIHLQARGTWVSQHHAFLASTVLRDFESQVTHGSNRQNLPPRFISPFTLPVSIVFCTIKMRRGIVTWYQIESQMRSQKNGVPSKCEGSHKSPPSTLSHLHNLSSLWYSNRLSWHSSSGHPFGLACNHLDVFFPWNSEKARLFTTKTCKK